MTLKRTDGTTTRKLVGDAVGQAGSQGSVRWMTILKRFVDAVDEQGRTFLMYACKNNHTQVVAWYLDTFPPHNRQLLNAVDDYGLTCAHAAAANDSEECLRMVVEAGVDAGVRNMYNTTPLRSAAYWGAAKCVKYLLTLADSNPGDVHPNTNTAATTAALRGFPEVAKMIQDEVRAHSHNVLFCAQCDVTGKQINVFCLVLNVRRLTIARPRDWVRRLCLISLLQTTLMALVRMRATLRRAMPKA